MIDSKSPIAITVVGRFGDLVIWAVFAMLHHVKDFWNAIMDGMIGCTRARN